MELHSHSNPRLIQGRWPAGTPRATLWYRLWRSMFRLALVTLWRARVFNRHYEPAEGSVLYISNHQSYMDPPLMGMGLKRPVNYMARDSLFRMPVLSQLIISFGAFPVKRNTADTGAIKEALRRLKAGGQVGVFPEGTRSPDGSIRPFLPGVAMLAQRAAQWTVPVLVDGPFECWPRSQPLPWPGRVVVVYGPPINQADIRDLPPEQVVKMIRDQIIAMQREIRQQLGWPAIPAAQDDVVTPHD